MAKFVKGDVVVVPFPFSDLTQAKRRPALVLAQLEGDDVILCQITSKTIKDNYALHFDGEKSIALYNLKNYILLQNNLISSKNTKELEIYLKAFIQSYNTRMITNKLTIN